MRDSLTLALPFDAHEAPLSEIALHWPVVQAFGGGLNSTASLVRWVVDGLEPMHRILFADTGCERPETYEHVARFSEWLVSHGLPKIEVTRKGGRQETIEEYALRTSNLPSLAYGRKGCSHKFKIEPQERDINRWSVAHAAWKRVDKVIKLIGYGAEEQKRISKAKIEDDKYF
jgi:3'-phosphoadenosine 5'-phosphosulfate sulfotransferase (PAPS reductase)/FAD synthetase